MSADRGSHHSISLENDLEDFLQHSLSGHVSTTPEGNILRVNSRLSEWLGYSKDELEGKRFIRFLAVGSRMFYETHLSPLLKLQGYFEEVSCELALTDGSKLQVLMNGYVRNDADGKPLFIRLNIYKATDRNVYEQNLRNTITEAEKTLSAERELLKLREQFIAVLGHDLRNPLGAIKSGASLLSRSAVTDRDKSIVTLIKNSSLRMEELIGNVMDFARVRLGGGISLQLEEVLTEPVLLQVSAELKAVFAERTVVTDLQVPHPVHCDAGRISQLVSNLVANALTHGSPDQPVQITARTDQQTFELSVSNGGKAIPENTLKTLFEPFTREASLPSQQGLGLGLYIAAEIAKAHQGNLSATSDDIETRFTFRMPLSIK